MLFISTVSVAQQSSRVQFYVLNGKITINKKPCGTCTISTYPLPYLAYADKRGMFVWVVPKDSMVMLSILLNHQTKVGYLIKVSPGIKFLNIKLDSVAAVQSIENQKAWSKNELYNSKHISALYNSEEYLKFTKMSNCPEPIIN